MTSRPVYTFLLVIAFITGTSITPALSQSILKTSKYIPAPFEVSMEITQVPLYTGYDSPGKIPTRGLTMQAGFRPKLTDRKLLVSILFMHTPKNRNAYNSLLDKPRIDFWAITANYLLLNPEMRINPFVGLGLGRYKIRDRLYYGPLPGGACNVKAGCSESPFDTKTLQALMLNYGLYVTVIPAVTLRGGFSLFKPLGSNFYGVRISDTKFTSTIGISARF